MGVEWTICAYRDVAARVGAQVPPTGGRYTGHHIIPDHCWYYASGVDGDAFLCPGVKNYHPQNAPVIIVSADFNGGKSQNHGLIHSVFDPEENLAAKNRQWTYTEARSAAIRSIEVVQRHQVVASPWSAAQLFQSLNSYFINTCGVLDTTVLRAGEHASLPGVATRSSPRFV